jgi:hypothetical protein
LEIFPAAFLSLSPDAVGACAAHFYIYTFSFERLEITDTANRQA